LITADEDVETKKNQTIAVETVQKPSFDVFLVVCASVAVVVAIVIFVSKFVCKDADPDYLTVITW
jgi:hypothetical protein